MKKSLKLRTLVTVLMIAALALAGCTKTPAEKAAKALGNAKTLIDKKDYDRAILELKTAAVNQPNNAEIYYQFGLVYEALGNLKMAASAYFKATNLDPKQNGAQLRLAKIMAVYGDDPKMLQDAQDRLTNLIQGNNSNSEALTALALTQLKLGNVGDGIQDLDQALQQTPASLSASIMMAQAKLMQKDQNGAEQALKQAVANTPQSSDALIVLGIFYIAARQPALAEEQFNKALVINSSSGPGLFQLGRLQNTLGRKQEAEQTFKKLSGLADKDYSSMYGIFLLEQGRNDEAINEFARLVKVDPNDRAARTRLVSAYQSMNRTPDAEAVLSEALKKNPKDVDAMLQRAELLVNAGKYSDAERDLNEVQHLRPESAIVHYIMSKVRQGTGNTLGQKQELTDALRLDPTLLAARQDLAQYLLTTSAPREALDVLDRAPDVQKNLVALIVQRNWALWAMNDMPEMRKSIDRGLGIERNADLLIQDGLWKLKTGNPAAARTSIEEALKVSPSDIRALNTLKETYLAQKQNAMAFQKIQEYAAKQTKSADVQDFWGMTLLVAGKKEDARKAFNAAKAANPRFVPADLSLVQLDIVERKYDDAEKRLQTVLASDSRNSTAHLWLGVVQEIKGNHNNATDNFQKAVDADPNNAEALNNLAYGLAEYKNQPDLALKYAQKAVELVPDRGDVADTLGWILYKKGLYAEAVRYLERAASHKENAVWKYHLAMAYSKAGDSARGKATLEAAVKQNPNSPEAKEARQVVGD